MKTVTIQLEVNDADGKARRLEMVDNILSQIHEGPQSPDLILLPETWGCGYLDFESYTKDAEALSGETFTLLSYWASKLGAFIMGGSIIESDGDSLYNTVVFVGRSGKLEASYRKIHLFGYQSKEPRIISRGQSPVVAAADFGVIGMTICYDLRFPEQYRKMIDNGAEIILTAAAWPDARISHWQLLNQARAIENQSWVISCNCSGTQKGVCYGGRSMIVSPTGEIVSMAGIDPRVLWNDIDPALARKHRDTFPALSDRVPL